MKVVAGIDLGGTAINYTFMNEQGQPLIKSLCEYASLVKEGPEVCLNQIKEGLNVALHQVGIEYKDVVAVGLDTPGPASSEGVFCARGSTNFVHKGWGNFDIRKALADRLKLPVLYLNDANAAAVWGHATIFGTKDKTTSVSAIIGTGLGGGIMIDGQILKGRRGFGGELGHVLIPYQQIKGIEGMVPECNCGRLGDLESLCSLTAIAKTILPYFLKKEPEHELAKLGDIQKAAKLVRGHAERGDALCRNVFRVQAHALGLFFDEMINTFDPDALMVGGGAIETGADFQAWFISEIRIAMPTPRAEQVDIPIHIMPHGDTAGARGAAIEALQYAKHQKLL